MVAPALLQNPMVRNWLGGTEPAWTLLDQPSFEALHRPPSPAFGPIRLSTDLTVEEVQQSAVARNALLLLQSASVGAGLPLTATGKLSREVVAEIVCFVWPGFDKTDAFRLHKVVNEPDFLPLFFVCHIVEASKLLRRYKEHLKTTPTGRRMVEESERQALQALLFHIAFWRLDLGYLAEVSMKDGLNATSGSFSGPCRLPLVSFRFSSSRAFSRLASDTSSPPYLAF